jgi:hypothetical protein
MHEIQVKIFGLEISDGFLDRLLGFGGAVVRVPELACYPE